MREILENVGRVGRFRRERNGRTTLFESPGLESLLVTVDEIRGTNDGRFI